MTYQNKVNFHLASSIVMNANYKNTINHKAEIIY